MSGIVIAKALDDAEVMFGAEILVRAGGSKKG